MDALIPKAKATETPIHIDLVSSQTLDAWLSKAPSHHQSWIQHNGFKGIANQLITLPNAKGQIEHVVCGHDPKKGLIWALAHLPARLPAGDYALSPDTLGAFDSKDQALLYMGFGLACYRFARYKTQTPPKARLIVPEGFEPELTTLLKASFLARDIVNTPANDMGPEELAGMAEQIAKANGASFKVIQGLELEEGFPAIHAVGRASSRDPRLITFKWGRDDAPSLALVGKGVVFDTGGLSIKPTSGMVLMKKDLGGAAHVLALAQVIMTLKLDIHLRVYIPAVENAISGNAYRPSDIIQTRKGTTVEVGNTDAEGRVVLADALALASEEGADRIIDFATLTGAARVALGEDLPPIYGRDLQAVRTIQDLSFELADPLWPMPLFEAYRELIEPPYADISNSGNSTMAGSITAALFLDHFVSPTIDWYHLDIYAWNVNDRPGRPIGGEAQGIRAMWAWLKTLYM